MQHPVHKQAISLARSSILDPWDGRILVIMGAEHQSDHTMISEVVVCFPDGTHPKAMRHRTDYSAVAESSDLTPSVEQEIRRLSVVAYAILREALKEADKDWRMSFSERRELLDNMTAEDLEFVAMTEDHRYPFHWILDHTKCGAIRDGIKRLVSLPRIVRNETSF